MEEDKKSIDGISQKPSTDTTSESRPFQPIDENDSKVISKKPKGKSPLKIILLVVLILVLLGLVAAASYWWRDKTANDLEGKLNASISSLENDKTSLKKQLADARAALSSSQLVCTPLMPTTTENDNIKASITSGNTAALEGYMSPSVNVILAASEAYGLQTPTQAVSDVTSFIAGAKSPWDFLLSASILSSYGKGGYGQYFSNIDTVGKSADGKVIAFSFDCNAKISTVFMSASEGLLQ